MSASPAQFAGAWQRIGEIAEAFVATLPNPAIALLVAVLFRVLAGWAGRAAVRFTDPHDRARAAGWVVGRLAEWAILSIGLPAAVSVVFPSFTAGDLIQVLGIGTVAVGFALKEILQNLFAGVLLLIGAPFRVGDEIAAVGHEGTVEDIQVRATLIPIPADIEEVPAAAPERRGIPSPLDQAEIPPVVRGPVVGNRLPHHAAEAVSRQRNGHREQPNGEATLSRRRDPRCRRPRAASPPAAFRRPRSRTPDAPPRSAT